MALITRSDDAPPIKQPAPVRITKPTYKGITVDTRYTPKNALLTSLEGSKWIVEYYQQVIDDDNGLNGQIVNRQPILQQYRLIKETELRVSSPLNQSQDDENKEMQITGSAHLHPTIIPNVGDMFLADIGDGREGVFRITVCERKTIFKDTAHFIEYILVDYSTEERRIDFKRKTIQTLYYLKDFNYYGQNPLIEEEEYSLIRYLEVQLRTITLSYFKRFFSNEYKTLILPGQEYAFYDHFVVKTIKGSFNTDEAPEIQFIRSPNISDDLVMKSFSVLDAILYQDKKYLLHSFREYGIVPTRSFTKEPMMESIYHGGLEYLIYPADNEVSVDYELRDRTRDLLIMSLREGASRFGDLDSILDEADLEGLPYGNNPLIKHVTTDNYYIFSSSFYNKDESESQSKFELMVKDHIEQKPISRKLLKVFCETYHAWNSLDRFYYTPILMMMIKSVLKGG